MNQHEHEQDNFLSACRNDKREHTIITVNGFQMRGKITRFDNFVIFVQTNGREQMVYKHAISTVI